MVIGQESLKDCIDRLLMPNRQSFSPATARARWPNASYATFWTKSFSPQLPSVRPRRTEERKKAEEGTHHARESKGCVARPGKGWMGAQAHILVLCAHACSSGTVPCNETRRLCSRRPCRVVLCSMFSLVLYLEGRVRTGRSIGCTIYLLLNIN